MNFIIFSLLIATTAPTKTPTRILDPHAYSLKQFDEVIQKALEADALSTQERLIAMRARLAVAEHDLEEMRSKTADPATGRLQVKPQMFKAAEARIDYFRKQVASLESKILKKR